MPAPSPPPGQGGQWGSVPDWLSPRVGDVGLCLPPRAVGDSSPNALITLIFPQCLDGIDYDDFNFGSHMMEQKEPLMETGKGPSGCALPGSPAAAGFPSRLTHTL